MRREGLKSIQGTVVAALHGISVYGLGNPGRPERVHTRFTSDTD